MGAFILPPNTGKSTLQFSLKSLIIIIFHLLIFFVESNNGTHIACEDCPHYPSNINRRIKSYVFVISEGIVQPDNYKQMGYLINGQFPGPAIYAKQFDTLQVTVVNLTPVPTAIHFHGLLQEHSLDADGVPWVTQDPIYPNETYVYEIELGTQTGTFMYHGHFGFDSVFIKGVVVIIDNPSYWHALGNNYHLDECMEETFLLGEIYHYSLTQFALDVLGPWKGKPPVKSLHINGYSYGEWEENNGDAPGYQVITVKEGMTYRFRIINLASDNMLRFSIEGHGFHVIEMDGILTFPVYTDHVEINSGQRYSIQVTMGKHVDNYWIHSELMSPFFGGPDNGRAILHYEGAPDPEPMRKQLFLEPAEVIKPTSWVLPHLMPNRLLSQSEVYELPKKHNKRILIDSMMKKENGTYQFLINGHHYQNPTMNYLQQVRNGVDIARNSKQVYEIMEGQVIDMVFQNRVMDDGPCLQHPWHLHGHSFWLVAEGPDTVDLNRLDSIIDRNVRNGRLQFRDVITMFPYQKVENTTSGAGCGWTVIRFIANNPGIWIAHCHINTHFLLGKKFVIYEYRAENPRLCNE